MAEFSEHLLRLQTERSQLEQGLEQLKIEDEQADDQREGSPFGKREEGATEAFELEKRMALEKQLVAALAEIDIAIKKIEMGIYGICESCHEKIEPARLEALPQAALCLKCKSRQMKNAR